MDSLDEVRGRVVREAKLVAECAENNALPTLVMHFDHGVMYLWDDGQACCEYRYMHTDDNLADMAGQTLVSMYIGQGPPVPDGDCDDGVKESQFLHIQTDQERYTLVNYNEHNGYYGGFNISIRWVPGALVRADGPGPANYDEVPTPSPLPGLFTLPGTRRN